MWYLHRPVPAGAGTTPFEEYPMKISLLRVQIDGHDQTVVIKDRTDTDPDVMTLMRLSSSCNAVVDIKVPRSSEGASALGRLIFGRRETDTIGVASVAEQLPMLSKKITELNLSGRSARCLENAGFEYVWQVAEKHESDLLKMRNFGRESLNEVREVIERLGLQLGMDLSSIKERLPT